MFISLSSISSGSGGRIIAVATGGVGACSFFGFTSPASSLCISGDVVVCCGTDIGGIIIEGGGGALPLSFLMILRSFSLDVSFSSSLRGSWCAIVGTIWSPAVVAVAAAGIGVDSFESLDTFERDVGVSGCLSVSWLRSEDESSSKSSGSAELRGS